MLDTYKNSKRLRKLNGWTQEELAVRMGYTDRSMIAKIENGKVNLGQTKILEFAKVLGVNASDLMGNDGIIYPEDTPEAKAIRDDWESNSTDMAHTDTLEVISEEDKLLLSRLHRVRQSTLDSINLLIEADLHDS